MRNILFAVIVASMSTPAWADNCQLQPAQSKVVDYQQGHELPVIIGPYQFNLPEKPSSLLAFDGVMAVYPNKEYVSYQLISDTSIAETLSRFTTRKLSAAALDRILYGIESTESLNKGDQNLIRAMRADLNLDCHTVLTRYQVGQSVDVILQDASGKNPEHRILFFSKDSSHLISVKGTKKRALDVLQSIKTRSF